MIARLRDRVRAGYGACGYSIPSRIADGANGVRVGQILKRKEGRYSTVKITTITKANNTEETRTCR